MDTSTSTSTSTSTPAYALAYLKDVHLGAEVIDYLQRIDETLAPFGGRFLVHGGRLTPVEGTWGGDIVIIAFPDGSAAEEWYGSAAYQEILPLRTTNSTSIAAIVEGVPADYRAVDGLADLLAQQAAQEPAEV